MDKTKEHYERLKTVLEQFNAHRQKGTLCDVTFMVEGQSFPAHKGFLASQSPYFEAMFTGQLKEATAEVVEMKDISSIAFEIILKYLYGSQVEFQEHIYSVMVAADMLGINSLLGDCKTFVNNNWKRLDVTIVISLSSLCNLSHYISMAIEDVKKTIRGDGNTQFYEIGPNYLCAYWSYHVKVHHTYFKVALEEPKLLLRPELAFKFLDLWLKYEPSRVCYLTELFPLYPLLRIPHELLTQMIDWAASCSSDIARRLNEIYRERRLNYSGVTLVVRCESNNNTRAPFFRYFRFESWSWENVNLTSSCSSSDKTYRYLVGNTIYAFNENEVHIFNINSAHEVQTYAIPTKSGKFICHHGNFLFMLETSSDNSRIVRINLSSPTSSISFETQICYIYASTMSFEDGIVHMIGSEKVTEHSEAARDQALYTYDTTSGFTNFVAYLTKNVVSPVLCRYKHYLLIANNFNLNERFHFLQAWDCTTNEITAHCLEYSKRSLENEYSHSSVHSFGISNKHENSLIMIITIFGHKVQRLLLATSHIETAEGSLKFSPLEIQACFLQTEQYETFAYIDY